MNTHTIYRTGFFIILAINGLLLFLLFRRPQMGPPPMGKKGLMDKISRELDLNNEQADRYFNMAKEHRAAIMAIEKEQRALLTSYFSTLQEATPDSTAQATRLAALSALEEQKIAFTYQHFEALKALCTPSQLIHFGEITEQLTQVLAGPEKNLPPPGDF